MGKYKVIVHLDDCIACGECYGMDDYHFQPDDDGYSNVKGGTTSEDLSEGSFDDDRIDEARDAEDNCPSEAIEVIEE